jgi:hypothetical protein
MLEQPSSKIPPTTCVGEDVGERNPGTLLVGIQVCGNSLEK